MTNKGSITRVFLTTLVIILSIVVIAPIGLVLLVDPNDYKQDIQDYVQNHSDYNVDIKGKITLSWYPWLGLEVQDLKLSSKLSNPQQTPLLTVKQAHLKIPVRRLLKKEFQLEAISLDNAQINIEIDAKGRLNWPTLSSSQKKKSSHATSTSPSTPNTAQTRNHSTTVPILPVDMLKIQNSTVRYSDKISGLETQLEHVDITINNLKPNAVTPIKTNFDFSIKEIKQKTVLYSGQALFSTNLKAHKSNWLLDKTYSDLKWQDIKQKQSHHITANTQIQIQPNQKMSINHIDANIDQTPIQGHMTIPLNQSSKTPIVFDFNLETLNLTPWLEKLATNAQPTFTKASQISSKQSSIPNAKGKITIQNLQYQNIKAQKVNLNIDVQNNKLKINPLTASLYNGTLKAQVAKNISDNSPTYIKGQLNHINMKSLLNDAADTQQLQGIGDIKFELTHTPQFTRGNSHVTIKQGVVQGFDLDYYYDLADSFINQKPKPTQKANGQTHFNQLTATLHLDNQQLNNPDLLIVGDDYKITGKGGLNLQQSLIKYDVMAIRLNNVEKLKEDLPLAVQIRGPLNHPTITPDLNVYAQMLLEQKGQRLISREINKLLGNDKNDTSDSGNDDETANKIEKEISKGLKKLFKF